MHVVVIYLGGPFLEGCTNLHIRTFWSLGIFMVFWVVFNSTVYDRLTRAKDVVKGGLLQMIRKVSPGWLA
jgi:hypothetical protein